MPRFFLILINCALLALLLLGLPAATHAQVVGYQVSKAPITQFLVFWGLGLAAIANLLAALLLIKDRKVRLLAWEWTGIFALLGLLQYALYRGWTNFNWLKTALEWCRAHF
jgi:uncharacterized membrane protein